MPLPALLLPLLVALMPSSSHGKRPSTTPPSGVQCATRPRKDCGPKWSLQEIGALIVEKRKMFLDELDCVDDRDLMTLDSTNWTCVLQLVMRARFSPCLRDGRTCKTKWNLILSDYKKIADYHARTGRNGPD